MRHLNLMKNKVDNLDKLGRVYFIAKDYENDGLDHDLSQCAIDQR
jgi:hypothetical protein